MPFSSFIQDSGDIHVLDHLYVLAQHSVDVHSHDDFLAMDFWTVKNVTGRILVGLRWWNQVKEDGTSEWIFESGSRVGQISSLDKNLFWIGLYVFPLYWALAAISNFLSFSPNFVILNFMGLAFSGTNAVGYTKCSRQGQQQVTNWASNQAMRVLVSNMATAGTLTNNV